MGTNFKKKKMLSLILVFSNLPPHNPLISSVINITLTDEGYSSSGIMYVALTCCWSRLYVSTRKVLRPAISAQVSLGFPASISECWVGSPTPSCYCMLLMQPTKIKSKPPKFMFVMFDMYVKLPPDARPIAVNKFYFTLFTLLFCRLWILYSVRKTSNGSGQNSM